MKTINSKPTAIFRHIKSASWLIAAIMLGGCVVAKVQYIPIEGLETARTKHFALIKAQCIKESNASSSSQAYSHGGILGNASSTSVATGGIANKDVIANNFYACLAENGYDIRCEGPVGQSLPSRVCSELVLFGGLLEETVIKPK